MATACRQPVQPQKAQRPGWESRGAAIYQGTVGRHWL